MPLSELPSDWRDDAVRLIKNLARGFGRLRGGEDPQLPEPTIRLREGNPYYARIALNAGSFRGSVTTFFAKLTSSDILSLVRKRRLLVPWSEIIVCGTASPGAIATARQTFVSLYRYKDLEAECVESEVSWNEPQFNVTVFHLPVPSGIVDLYGDVRLRSQATSDSTNILLHIPGKIPISLHTFVANLCIDNRLEIGDDLVGCSLEFDRGTFCALTESDLGKLPIAYIDLGIMKRAFSRKMNVRLGRSRRAQLTRLDTSERVLELLPIGIIQDMLDPGPSACDCCWSLVRDNNLVFRHVHFDRWQEQHILALNGRIVGHDGIIRVCDNCTQSFADSRYDDLLRRALMASAAADCDIFEIDRLMKHMRTVQAALDSNMVDVSPFTDDLAIERIEEALHSEMSQFSSSDIIAFFRPMLDLNNHEVSAYWGLDAIQRQYLYVVQILAGTAEPSTPAVFSKKNQWRIVFLLAALTEAFVHAYGPTDGQMFTTIEEESAARLSAMAFIDAYCNLPAYTGQSAVERLINTAVWNYKRLPDLLGLSLEEVVLGLLDVCRHVSRRIADTEATLEWAVDLVRSSPLSDKVYHRLDSGRRYLARDPSRVPPDVVNRFIQRFSVRRGESQRRSFVESVDASGRPLFLFSDTVVPVHPMMLVHVVEREIDRLHKMHFSEGDYSTRRGALNEYQVARALHRICPDDMYYEDIYLRRDGLQRDYIINAETAVLCIEAKAVRRNAQDPKPGVAFRKLRRNFLRGPADALRQARMTSESLELHFTQGFPLFKEGGGEISIAPRSIERTYVHIAITAEEYESMAEYANLVSDSVPRMSVIVAAHQFEFLVDAFVRIGYGIEDFARFFAQRARFSHLVKAETIYGWAAAFVRGRGSLEGFAKEGSMNALHGGYDFANAMQRWMFTGDRSEFDEFIGRAIRPEPIQEPWQRSWKPVPVKASDLCPCGSRREAGACHFLEVVGETASENTV